MYVGPNDIKNENPVKYLCMTGIKNGEILVVDTRMVF